MRVLDATVGIAGAYCGKLLADSGADVYLAEVPGGHPLAGRRPSPAAAPGALFAFLSAGKVAAGDRTDFDVVLADAGSGAQPVPSRIRVSFSPFGLDGPWATRPATEITLQAMTGSVGKRRLPGRPPVFAGGAPIEFAAGSYAAA
ncbi:MAG TPA: CoA transferase, partial [Acidimicrobiales bacterium]|nr:CoA transferase [Acidimicrobiales bacterium]